MHPLSFIFLPSEGSNDHQVRVLISGQDILAKIRTTWFGLDPVQFFAQEALRSSGTLFIGRCSCGDIGCGNVSVFVERSPDKIEWAFLHEQAEKLVFASSDYDRAIEEAASDFSWESIERTAERLVSQLDYSPLLDYGLRFKWASAQLAKDKISASFSYESGQQTMGQRILGATWNHQRPEDAVSAMQEKIEQTGAICQNGEPLSFDYESNFSR